MTSTGTPIAVKPGPKRPALGVSRLPMSLLVRARDERLVGLVRSGLPTAFEAIYDRHHSPILSFCRHMLGSREDAEDAAQQTFISAHRGLVGTTQPIELRPWLYAIARNRCLSTLRTHKHAHRLDAQPDGAGPWVEGLAETVQRREELRELVADLADLPVEQRAALVLFELGDLTHPQIAQVLECEPSRVKSLVFQARTSLMSQRAARDIECGTIRQEIANARGSALLRGHLRRHLRGCPECSAFATEVRGQRGNLALVLPVIPSAGLKAGTMSGALGGHAAGSGGPGALGVGAANGLAAKALVGAALATGTFGAGVMVLHRGSPPPRAPRVTQPSTAGRGAPAGRRRGTSAQGATDAVGGHGSAAQALHRSGLRPRRVRSDSAAAAGANAVATAPRAPAAGALKAPTASGAAGANRQSLTATHRPHTGLRQNGTPGPSGTARGRTTPAPYPRGSAPEARRVSSPRHSPTSVKGRAPVAPPSPSPAAGRHH